MSEKIDIAAQWREEARQRDWGRVHVEADRRPFFGTVGRTIRPARGEGVKRERGGFRG
jgi:hypothetical protein